MDFYKILASFLVLIVLVSCDDKAPKEEESYNAFFIYPGSKKKAYVGTVTGLSSCKYVVSNYYTKRRKYIKGEWDYICCLRNPAAGNECVEMRKYGDD